MRSSFMTHFSMFGFSSDPLCLSKWTVLKKTVLFLNAASFCFPSVERRATERDVCAQTAGGPAGGEEAERAEEELLGPGSEPTGTGPGQ